MDSEKTPAQGVAALRRRRQGPTARQARPTFIDFTAGLAHSEVVEDVRLAAAGTRCFTRLRVRHALPQASSATIWSWTPGELEGCGMMSGDVTGIDVCDDGRTIVLWSLEKGYFNVVEPSTLRSLTIGWRTPRVGRWGVRFDPRECMLSPDGGALAVLGERGQLAVYLAVDALGPDLTHAEGVRGVAWSPDGTQLAIVDAAEVSVVDVATGEHVWRQPRPRAQVRACHVAWDPSGRRLLLADANLDVADAPLYAGRSVFTERENPRGGPELRSALDGVLTELLPYEMHATRVAWSDDGSRLLLIARPGGLLVWDVERRQPAVHDPTVVTAAFGPRGAWIALAEEGGRAVLVRWLP